MDKKKIMGLVLGIGTLMLAIGFSLGFFTSNSSLGINKGNEVSGSTNKTPETTFKSEELLKPNNTNIYPGHKSIAAIKVTATGVNDVSYDLTWRGTNTLGNYNYSIYKTTTEENPEFNCKVKTKNIENVGNVYYEECTSDLSSLGEEIDSGIIEKSSENITTNLLVNQLMNATSEGNTIYYYLVLEFPNIDEAQEGQGGKFEGAFNATKNNNEPDLNIMAVYLEQEDGTYKFSQNIPSKNQGYGLDTKKSSCSNNATVKWDYENWGLLTTNLTTNGTSCNLYFDKGNTMDNILANYNTSTRSDFSTIYADENSKTVFIAEDGLGTSKYFAGAPTDNYVKFGGFYWRIIRLNGDKTTRLIYAGNASVIDGLSNKQTVLANGYDDSTTDYTQIKESKFNLTGTDNAYVGFKYEVGSLRGTTSKSTILEELDTWYEANLKASYGKYIDGSTGFCGDRTPSTDPSTNNGIGGTGTTDTYYGDYIRLKANKSPVLTCANSSDLYTTSGASRGNKSLSNPIGLINADEVAFAGGVYGTAKQSYYLRTNNHHWTMSPSRFDSSNSGARVFYVNATGYLLDNYIFGVYGVRPVINLTSTTRFTGTGTWDDPFQVIET